MSLRELVLENPMLVEVGRFKRRFFEAGRGRTLNTMVLVVAIISYVGLLLVVFNFAGDVPPGALIHLQTGVFALLAPSMAYGMIAGERDRRSWDFLLVAPISRKQIVVGKYLAALAGLLGGWALFMLPTLITAITYQATSGDRGTVFFEMLLQEILSLSFGAFAVALTLFFSARSRRAFAALALGLGAMFVLLVVVPALGGIIAPGDSSLAQLFLYFHPHWALEHLLPEPTDPPDLPSFAGGIPHVALYLVLAFALVSWAARTLTYADGDRRPRPESSRA